MRPIDYLTLMAQPWNYNRSEPVAVLERRLAEMYGSRRCLATSNGRSALYTIFKSLEAGPGDEVILQAFTCVAAMNPLVWTGFKPVFADADPDTLGLSLESVRERITDRTRAILVQHTFGVPAAVKEIADLAAEHDIVVVEDCAHALGVTVDGRRVGTFGNVAMLSFGIDKQLSSKTGGAVVAPEGALGERIQTEWARLKPLSRAETLRWLLFPLIRIGLRHLPHPTSDRTAKLLERTGILRQAVTAAELRGGFPPGTPAGISGALARVILSELDSLGPNLEHRATMSALYRSRLAPLTDASWKSTEARDAKGTGSLFVPAMADGPLMRFPVLFAERSVRDRVRARLQAVGFDVTGWYDPPIFPAGVDLGALGYDPAQTPVARDLAARVLCLPTGRNINAGRAETIGGIIAQELAAA